MEESVMVPLCTKEASTIQAIDKKSVHRICSGQVVLTLATAVKELVENSIDAGATNVEVKLKDYGSESIEVSDNGGGIEEKNFEGVTLKHHTSKLQDFEDLINVSTFGFRGEALSSLCALSNMSLVTRHKSVNVGTRLEFDVNGRISQRKNTPRQFGTTVTVQNIFHTLPVRHKEFQRNLKKEFARLVQVLNAYCIINTGVRISCVNQTTKGSRSTIVSTNGNVSLKDNIINVFGPKQLLSLMEFQQIQAKEDICSEFGLKSHVQSSINFKINGFVSKCEHGQGRSTSDRQFLFINKRPCDVSKIIKTINEVYHSYNRHQNPFIALHIEMNKESVDVNVTPDKRQIFVDGEKVLLAVLKSSLIDMYEPTTSVYKLNNTSFSSASSFSVSLSSTPSSQKGTPSVTPSSSRLNDSQVSGMSLSRSLSSLKRSFSSAFDKNKDSPSTPISFKNTKKSKTFSGSPLSSFAGDRQSEPDDINSNSMLKFVSYFSRKGSNCPGSETVISNDHNVSPIKDRGKSVSESNDEEVQLISTSDDTSLSMEVEEVNGRNMEKEVANDTVFLIDKRDGNSPETECKIKSGVVTEDRENTQDVVSESGKQEIINKVLELNTQDSKLSINPLKDVKADGFVLESGDEVDEPDNMAYQESPEEDQIKVHVQETSSSENLQITDKDIVDDQEDRAKKEMTVNFSLLNLKSRMQRKSDSSSSSSFSRSFRAKICPGDNQSAEEELSREISKDMFAKMKILGQFNLGFIITQLGSDLFIVDQHATDEKYNFEMLQRNTVLQSQRLIMPQNLELTASNETILVDNLEIFKKNGFDFIIDPEALPTQRVKLISAPVSKNWNFGKDDIEELLFMLTDSPDVMCRPSRVRMMFASRACRKSIMIGTALNQSEMKRVVNHMGDIEQPWNCPHGRPTMRHLFNMKMLPP